MALAVCIQCGYLKKSPYSICISCHYSPKGDHQAMAKSLLLSDSYFDPERDYKPGKKELQEASERLQAGNQIDWDETILARLVEEQRELERYGSPSWLKIVLLLFAMFIIPIIALIVYILRATNRP